MSRAARLAPPGLFLVLAVLGHLPAFAALRSSTQCACRDAPQSDWFLAWTPYAVLHGHSPWTTSALDVPGQVNLMWNTLMPLPGMLALPVTATAGIFAAHTLLSVFAFFSSATSMWWVAGRWAAWAPARTLAGLVYGFSPYMVGQGSGHLNLTLMALPPLVLALLDDLLVRRPRPVWRTGVALGAVTAAQLYTSEEVLASTFLVCLAGVAMLLAQHRAVLTRERVVSSARGLAVAAGTLLVLAAWPLAVQFAGPARVSGPVQDTSPFAADVLGMVVPTVHQLFGTALTAHWAGNDSENGSYLGLPLLVLVLLLAHRFRALPVMRFSVPLAAVVWVLSLGTRLHVGGLDSGLPMPFAALAAVPVLRDINAVRLAAYVALLAALVLAVGLDRLQAEGALQRARSAWAAVLLAALLPVTPNWPYAFQRTEVPAYFSGPQLSRVDPGAVVLTYPVPRFPRSAPMAWQVVGGFRYRQLGGYVITPDGRGGGTFTGHSSPIEATLGPAEDGRHLPPVTRSERRAALAAMRALKVDDVIVSTAEPGAAEVTRYLAAVLGRPPDDDGGGVRVWYGLPT